MIRMSLAAYEKRLIERKALVRIEAPANSGTRRTPLKRAILRELEDAQRAQGQQPKFPAKY